MFGNSNLQLPPQIFYGITVFYNRYDNFSNTFNHFPKLLTQLAQHLSV